MKNVMLDLETLGQSPTSAVVAIGAVEFDLDVGTLGRTFYATIDAASAVRYGSVCGETLKWWLQQSDAARAEIATARRQLPAALNEFASWLGGCSDEPAIWGNGASFDNAVLQSAYRATGVPCPWPYYKDRCYRTVKTMAPGVALVREGTHHHALDDARSQAIHLIQVTRVLRGVS